MTTSGQAHRSPETDAVSANQLGDYSYITAPLKNQTDKNGVVLRCATGLGPASGEKSTDLGDWYFGGAMVPVTQICVSESKFEVRQAHLMNFPGILNLYPCGNLTHDEEGIYSCKIKNSSMMNQTTRVGLYLSGRSESLDIYPIILLLIIFCFYVHSSSNDRPSIFIFCKS